MDINEREGLQELEDPEEPWVLDEPAATDAFMEEEAPPVWQPLNPVPSNLYYWTKAADRSFGRNFGRLLKECGIIASEWSALRQLYGPQRRSPVELGQMIGMSKGGASKLVSRLVAKGLVVKVTYEFDRRFRAVGLTRQGKEMVEFLVPIEKNCDRQLFKPLGNARRYRLAEWLKQILTDGRLRGLEEWVSAQQEQQRFPRADAGAAAAAAAEAAAKAEAFWEMCRLAVDKAASAVFGSG